MSSQSVARMIAALGVEIEAIKKRGGSSAIEVSGGRFKGHSENGYLYTFPISTEIYLRDDSPIKVVVGKDESDGIVVSLGEGILIVSTERDFGPKISFARIVSDDSFLVERLRDKLKKVEGGTADFNSKTAEQVIGNQAVNTSPQTVDERVFLGTSLNEEQRHAVVKAVANDVTYIWGPPGTGKTTVLARIVQAYYYAGLSVLLVSNTNVAVDKALEEVAKRLKLDEGFQQGAVLRHGPIVMHELDRDYGDKVEIEKVVNRLGERLTKEKVDIELKKKNIQQESILYKEAIKNWDRLKESQSDLDNLEKTFRHLETKKQSTNETVDSLDGEIESLNNDLQRSLQMGGIHRFFSGLSPDRIRSNLASAEAKLSANKSILDELEKELPSLRERIRYQKEQIRNLKNVVVNHPSYIECKEKIEEFDNRISEIDKNIKEVQKQLDELRSQVIGNCRVLATTIYRTYLKGQVERKFDVVVIDEASMLALPMSYYGAGRANQHVVVTGDFRQLPPIIMSTGELAEEWLKQDVFYKAGIPESVKQKNYPESLVALRKQYRMADSICDVVNELFYDDHKLETVSQNNAPDTVPFPYGESSLFYLNTSSYHPWTSMKIGTYSRYNLFHALIARNFVYSLHEKNYLGDHRNVGVISPYAEQTHLIDRLVSDHIDNRDHVIVSTVHRFQGNEKDVIVFDITDSLGTWPSKFIKATDRKEDGTRLLNVALSRAKRRIVLIANFDYLQLKLSPKCVVRKIIEMFLEKATEIKIDTVLPLGPDDWIDGLRKLEPPIINFDDSQSGIFDEGTFFGAFAQDLLKADSSVVIFSPFITQNGTSRLMDVISLKVSQDVRVRLVTRPPGDHGGVLEEGLADILNQVCNAGVVVDFRAKMHEKFAIIDKKVLWYGSLNIFSHRDTSETMFRIVSPSVCEEMVKFVVGSYNKKERDDTEDVDLSNKENPNCPNCSSPMIWKNGKYGVYYECTKCDTKIDHRRSKHKSRTRRNRTESEKKCSICGRPMRKRKGKYGFFWGCTGYPQHCKNTEPI